MTINIKGNLYIVEGGSITYTCSNCGEEYEIKDPKISEDIKCPKCGYVIARVGGGRE